MDGITFLKKIMAERPTPVVICSSLTEKGAETTMQALAAGAVAIVTKPKLGVQEFLHDASDDLVEAVKAASQRQPAQPGGRRPGGTLTEIVRGRRQGETTDARRRHRHLHRRHPGAGSGSDRPAARIVPALLSCSTCRKNSPTAFSPTAERPVPDRSERSRDNDRVLPGRALIAPGGRHMLLKRSGAQYHVEVVDGPPVNSPSSVGGCVVPLGGQLRRQQRAGHHHDRHGR